MKLSLRESTDFIIYSLFIFYIFKNIELRRFSTEELTFPGTELGLEGCLLRTETIIEFPREQVLSAANTCGMCTVQLIV